MSSGTWVIELSGPGGVGKIRLTIEAVTRFGCHVPDDLLFVPLADVANVDHVDSAILQALGLHDGGDLPLQTRDLLAQKHPGTASLSLRIHAHADEASGSSRLCGRSSLQSLHGSTLQPLVSPGERRLGLTSAAISARRGAAVEAAVRCLAKCT